MASAGGYELKVAPMILVKGGVSLTSGKSGRVYAILYGKEFREYIAFQKYCQNLITEMMI